MSVNTRDRKFELLLYPDATNYDCNSVLLNAQKLFPEWAYILHNEDVMEDGSPKKPHIHFMGRCNGLLTLSGISYRLSLPETSIRFIKSWKGAIRYLAHYDNREKHQYSLDYITSSFDITPYFKTVSDDADQASQIYYYIINNRPNLEDTVKYVLDNNLWSAFRRGFAVWAKLIKGEDINECYRYSKN